MIVEARGVMALERQEMERAMQGLSLHQLSGKILESVVTDLFSEDEKARIVAEGMKRIREWSYREQAGGAQLHAVGEIDEEIAARIVDNLSRARGEYDHPAPGRQPQDG